MRFNWFHELQQCCFVSAYLRAYDLGCFVTSFWGNWNKETEKAQSHKDSHHSEGNWGLQMEIHRLRLKASELQLLFFITLDKLFYYMALQSPHLQMGASTLGLPASQDCPEDQVSLPCLSEECGERRWHSHSWCRWRNAQLLKQKCLHFPLRVRTEKMQALEESSGQQGYLVDASQ